MSLQALVLSSFVTQLSAVGEASTAYNDSAFLVQRMQQEQILLADGVYTLRAGFLFAAESERSRHVFEYRLGYQGFLERSDQNNLEHRGDWTSEVDVSDRWTLRIADRLTYANANSVAELGAPVTIGSQAAVANASSSLSATRYIENAIRLGAEYNVEDRWQLLPEAGVEMFAPLDLVGSMAEVPINTLVYQRVRGQRGFSQNTVFLREEQNWLVPPGTDRHTVMTTTVAGGWQHQFTPDVESRLELGGTVATDLDDGRNGLSPLVALGLRRREETMTLEFEAGFENTVNIEFGGLSDVYYSDLSVVYRPTVTWTFEAAGGYRLQQFQDLVVRGQPVSASDIVYGMGGLFYNVTPELSVFARYIYRRQVTDTLEDITFTRHVGVAGVRMEWPPVTQRRIR